MNILEEIVEVKKEEVKNLKKKYSFNSFNSMEYFQSQSRSFKKTVSNQKKISIIAEVKKASPSKGIIQNNFNHIRISEAYQSAGADAISVLTDEKFFKGHLNFLSDIRKQTNIPLLRKDFLIDEYQILEAKAFGADAILLISEILSINQIKDLTDCAIENNLDVLLELHSENEISKIDFNRNDLIGINNRDLKTFEVDLTTTERVLKKIDKQITSVSESGISKRDDIEYLKSINVNAILVGEHFMRSENPADELKQFTEWCRYEN
ncbi:Indole-3-glycerol phosphate synthase [Ignavibacterium album JCM 16511]|uniref:Indole-3-glycerol phosphate synthase n=1 Tax=Ignavibacterium album (strain DSM 19864 / JCM 16511 / NBRC 101810 / Mat9-16) TaxID=945713 RepID=I0AM87_IGNAJ|nr:indole-3-glycerol phosphate synthase TrpC [Ignavibacterium album]AFH50094.1 Indole-3-glycerol phosphate synthase [Ignavibacterium album JCM 16511]